MKKIVTLSLILILTICIMGNVYGAFSCQINMETSKTQVSKNDEFSINVNVSNIQSEKGVISFGGTLEYDKDSLTLVKMEGQNGWETPSNGSTYNEAKGKIAIARNGVGKNNETILKITFKVKETKKQNLTIRLKDMTIADGTVPFKISNVSQNITITEGTQSSVSTPVTDNKVTESNKVSNTNFSTTNSTVSSASNESMEQSATTKATTNTAKKTTDKTSAKTSSLPKAGDANYGYVLLILISLVVVVAGIFFLKIRILNKEIKQ